MSETRRGANEFTVSAESGRALENAAKSWFTAVTECQREMRGFVSMRFEKYGKTAREMLGCKNLADVTAIQSRWIEEILRDYSSETTKLMTLCTKAMSTGG